MIKYYIILHIIVFIWGFTGILGDAIQLPAEKLTFFRMFLALGFALLMGVFVKRKKAAKKEQVNLFLTGIIVGLHWFFFFEAIKVSTVSIAVVCMSSATLFTSLLDPILNKRKLALEEIILSFFIIAGISIISGFETDYYLGIIYGLISAFFAALFTVFNGRFIKQKIHALEITIYEMLGGSVVLFIMVLMNGYVNEFFFTMRMEDFLYLLLLSSICTSVAFLVSVWVMKQLTPFTVSMSINMEPIYTILIVVLYGIFTGGSDEIMSTGFYIGAAIIIGSIFANAFIKRKMRKRMMKTA